jgi:hypothetical protein
LELEDLRLERKSFLVGIVTNPFTNEPSLLPLKRRGPLAYDFLTSSAIIITGC